MTIPDYLHFLKRHYGLYETGPGFEFVGLRQGITLHAVAIDKQLTILFHSPQLQVSNALTNQLQGLPTWVKEGLPADWLQARQGDETSVVLQIDSQRLAKIDKAHAKSLVDWVIQDLHKLGAKKETICTQCGKQPASAAMRAASGYAFFCPGCWKQWQANAPRVRWRRLLIMLLSGTTAATGVWAVLQQLHWPTLLMAAFPLLFGWALTALLAVTRIAFTPFVRFGLFLAITVVVLTGNCWGHYQDLLQKNRLTTVADAARSYMIQRWTEQTEDEIPSLVAGIVGVWAGLACFSVRRD